MDRKVSRDPRGPDEQKRPTTLDGTKSGCGSGGSGNGSDGIIGRQTISFFYSLSLYVSLSFLLPLSVQRVTLLFFLSGTFCGPQANSLPLALSAHLGGEGKGEGDD